MRLVAAVVDHESAVLKTPDVAEADLVQGTAALVFKTDLREGGLTNLGVGRLLRRKRALRIGLNDDAKLLVGVLVVDVVGVAVADVGGEGRVSRFVAALVRGVFLVAVRLQEITVGGEGRLFNVRVDQLVDAVAAVCDGRECEIGRNRCRAEQLVCGSREGDIGRKDRYFTAILRLLQQLDQSGCRFEGVTALPARNDDLIADEAYGVVTVGKGSQHSCGFIVVGVTDENLEGVRVVRCTALEEVAFGANRGIRQIREIFTEKIRRSNVLHVSLLGVNDPIVQLFVRNDREQDLLRLGFRRGGILGKTLGRTRRGIGIRIARAVAVTARITADEGKNEKKRDDHERQKSNRCIQFHVEPPVCFAFCRMGRIPHLIIPSKP